MTQATMRVFVEAVGVLAPGLKDWDSARLVLAGEQAYRTTPLEVPTPACLPSAERRRSSANVRLAITAAEQALARTPMAAQDMAMVFASREAAGVITQQICEVLADSRQAAETALGAHAAHAAQATQGSQVSVSPTQFHNSVHNAPSGYFSIAMNAKLAATSVCGGAWSFAAGLLNAAAQVLADNLPVLFVCYDSPLPAPLSDMMPVLESTAIALVLTPMATARSMAQWEIALMSGKGETPPPDWMPAVWDANASARGFAALATLVENPSRAEATLALSPELSLQVTRC